MKVILCKPNHFRVEYSINAWMDTSVQVNKDKLFEQYEGLKSVYKNLGVEIIEIEQEKNLPDMVYTRDWGFSINDKFILAKFKFKERKGEQEIARRIFKDLGYEVFSWTGNNHFEGGDLIYNGDKIFFGYGKRSSFKTKKRIEDITKIEVLDFKTWNNHYFHLDTFFFPLDKNNVVYYPDAISMLEQAKIAFRFSNPIAVSDEDAKNFACNLVQIGKNLITPANISKELETKLLSLGYETHKVDISEYLKGGGGIACVSLLFE